MQLPEWKYDTAWSRIITKGKDGLQVVVIDQVGFKRGRAIVKKANRLIRIKNEVFYEEKRKFTGNPEKYPALDAGY